MPKAIGRIARDYGISDKTWTLSNGKGVGIAGLQISQGDTAYTEVCAGPWAPASRACGVKRRAPSMECKAARGKRGV